MPSIRYYTNEDMAKAALSSDVLAMLDCLEQGFEAYDKGELILPEKASQILDEATQSRVNCMPCTVPGLGYSCVKLVSVFPDNVKDGLPNVSGMILVLSSDNGTPIAMLDAGFPTALRTALVGSLGAKCLAVAQPKSIGMLGSGEEALMHLFVLAKLFPSVKVCRVASRNPKNEKRFADIAAKLFPDLIITCCDSSYEKAARNADIIVTAISGQVPLLKADWVKQGAFYCHVGGIEDEYDVALKADKIVCDSWEALKHRGSPTISHMYRDGVLTDDDIYAELAEIVRGRKPGRETKDEITYFNSIGLAFTDVYMASFLITACDNFGLGQEFHSSPFTAFDLGNIASWNVFGEENAR